MKCAKLVIAQMALLIALLVPRQAAAGVFEFSLGFSYSKSNYSDSNFAWSRRWGASLGYHITNLSEIELAFQDIMTRTKISGFEDTTFNDKVYSVNWVQALAGKSFPIQPYVKLGVGQLNRDASGTYSIGGIATVSPPAQVDSVTVVVGAGLRIFVFKNLAIRNEATSYLSGGSIRTWKDNIAINFGLSLYF